MTSMSRDFAAPFLEFAPKARVAVLVCLLTACGCGPEPHSRRESESCSTSVDCVVGIECIHQCRNSLDCPTMPQWDRCFRTCAEDPMFPACDAAHHCEVCDGHHCTDDSGKTVTYCGPSQ